MSWVEEWSHSQKNHFYFKVAVQVTFPSMVSWPDLAESLNLFQRSIHRSSLQKISSLRLNSLVDLQCSYRFACQQGFIDVNKHHSRGQHFYDFTSGASIFQWNCPFQFRLRHLQLRCPFIGCCCKFKFNYLFPSFVNWSWFQFLDSSLAGNNSGCRFDAKLEPLWKRDEIFLMKSEEAFFCFSCIAILIQNPN